MKLCSIASGSSGNCVYVGERNSHILVDAGISGKRIEAGLAGIGVHPSALSGILITHEHTDHTQGVGVLARKYKVPLYGTVETLHAMMKGKSNIGKVEESLLRSITPDIPFQIGEITVQPFSTSHDASNPVCYTFEANGHKAAMATDLGMYDDYIVEHLQDAELLYLEANHDENMLLVGSYPYYLKQRILGKRGHLSNDTAARLVTTLLHPNLKSVALAHLSKENNLPELAYETVRTELEQKAVEIGIPMPELFVAERDCLSKIMITG